MLPEVQQKLGNLPKSLQLNALWSLPFASQLCLPSILCFPCHNAESPVSQVCSPSSLEF